MQTKHSSFCISSMLGNEVISSSGKRLGCVADVELSPGPDYSITGLFFGRGGLQHRLHLINPFERSKGYRHKPNRVAWTDIERIEKRRIVLKAECSLSYE